MLATKYIVFNLGTIEDMIIFSGLQQHANIAHKMRLAGEVVSAGFLRLSKDGPICYGDSLSLETTSRPEEDTKIARRLFDID